MREHSELIRPPRALWVPFPLGRPFGAAEHPDFQRDVLRHALDLLDSAREPTLVDYPRDAPAGEGDGVWACAISLPEPDVSDLEAALRSEVDLLRPWYEEARRRRGRTTVGMSGARPDDIDTLVTFIAACAEGAGLSAPPTAASGPAWRHPMPILLRFVVEDLRAFYQEAVTSRPGASPPTQHEMHGWIFEETALGRALLQLGQQIAAVNEPALMLIRGFIIPEGFWPDGPTWGTAGRALSTPEALQRTFRVLSGQLEPASPEAKAPT